MSLSNKIIASAACLFFLSCKPALALDQIYSPQAEEGELAVEYSGSTTFDPDTTVSDAQEHAIALEYGINSWWTAEIGTSYSKDPHDTVKMNGVEVESRFQLTEPGEYWLDTGLLLAYGFSTQAHVADTVEAKLLLQKDIDRFTGTVNVGFESDVGNGAAPGGPDYVFLANARYRAMEEFQPGIELQSELGQSHSLGAFDQQEHYIGPAVYGKLFGSLKYQAAWLFGATDASAQSAARLLLEYEMHF